MKELGNEENYTIILSTAIIWYQLTIIPTKNSLQKKIMKIREKWERIKN